ncbi:MAG TPA: SAM-dependent methyltransferase, partial [Myxococcaceae bacterium]
RHWGHPLRGPQEVLAALPAAGYEPDFSETLGLDETEALYASAPEELADEAALHRAGAAAISFAIAVGRRREPDEKPRPSRDRG